MCEMQSGGVQASEMACKVLQSEDLGEDEIQPAPKLLEVILQNCRGRVDEYLPLYMQAGLLTISLQSCCTTTLPVDYSSAVLWQDNIACQACASRHKFTVRLMTR